MQLQLQLLQHLLLLLLPLLLLGCCCRFCCRSVAILAMPSVRLSTIVCSDDDADEDQDEARPGSSSSSHCSNNNNCTGNGNGHVDAAAERTMQRAQVHFSWMQLRTAAPVIDLGYRTPKRQNSCMHRQRDRQGEWGRGGSSTGRQTDRQVGRQAGPSEGPRRAYLHAIKFPGLLLLSQGLCDHIESRF